jgi:FkbM family methyltransferase
MLTYAQNFEDVMLARLFQRQSQGFYVDIGAWHPSLHSVTRHFYDLGWSGINVEPIRQQYNLFVAERPRDQNMNVAVSDTAGRMMFHECKDLSSLSTANPDQAKALEQAGHTLVSYEVDVVTLRDIALACGGRTVDFLKVDVEGLEGSILTGGDWRAFRPRVLVIEATIPALSISDWDDVASISNWQGWEPLLLERGYILALYDGLSRFYVRGEESHLASRLALPPGVHDDLHFPELERLRLDVEAISGDRDEKARVIERLVREVGGLKADRQLKADLVENLASENTSLREDQRQREDAASRLVADIASVRQDRALKADALSRLAKDYASVREDQHLKAEAIERLATENVALRDDQRLKAEAIERLATENAALRDDQRLKAEAIERLAIENAALRDDQRQKAEAIEKLVGDGASLRDNLAAYRKDLDRISLERELLVPRLSAKDDIIRGYANQDLERKALFAGAADVAWHWRRGHAAPVYGDLVPPARPTAGLHVGVDTLEIVFGVSGGVETYMKMLVRALLQGHHRVTLICLPEQLSALQRQFDDQVGYFVMRASRSMRAVQSARRRLHRPSSRVTAALSMATFSRLAEDLGIELLHSPVQIFSALDFRLPTVLNLHDLQHLHFPENFRPSDIDARNRLYGLSAALANAIIVSSEFVRNDLVAKMAVPSAKVFTVPVTWDPVVEAGLGTFSAEAARAHYGLPAVYALYPAQFWPHKNHARLVDALRIVRDRRPAADLRLVFTGYRGHDGWPEVEKTIRRLGLEDEVICLDHVPTEHLAGLYRGALFCVMPSTFEASSYPVIEAQILGVPAMCSNVTSLPELMADGAGLLFDPFDSEDIAAQMLRWVDDPRDRAEHAARGAIRARRVHSLQNYVDGLGLAYQFALGKTS